MEELKPETRKILHDLESKSASLKSAARLLRDCPPAERREMLALMRNAAKEIVTCLDEMEKSAQ
jgi:hypothetical protein